jgi:hypothetical protein
MAQRWQTVFRGLAKQCRLPVNVVDYQPKHINAIADAVGDAFFGRTFVPMLRRTGWQLRINPSPLLRADDRRGLPGAAVTGWNSQRRFFHTDIEAAVVDHYLPVHVDDRRFRIRNDGFEVNTRVEWVAHIVGHELVHCLQMIVCGHGDRYHDAEFSRLNRKILGGHSYVWKIVPK